MMLVALECLGKLQVAIHRLVHVGRIGHHGRHVVRHAEPVSTHTAGLASEEQ